MFEIKKLDDWSQLPFWLHKEIKGRDWFIEDENGYRLYGAWSEKELKQKLYEPTK
jgi:hypothetical protein